MIIDLRTNLEDIKSYFKQRVSRYLKRDEPPMVYRADIGFTFGQDGWVILVLDSRPDAEMDGEWTKELGDSRNYLSITTWRDAFFELEEDEAIGVIEPDGTNKLLTESIDELGDDDEDYLAQLIGDMLKSLVLSMFEDGVFNQVPLSENYDIGIEEFDAGGNMYCWRFRNNEATD